MFHLDLLLLADESSLAEVSVLDVEKVYLVSSFGQEPLVVTFESVFAAFRPAAGLERVEVVAEVDVLFFDSHQVPAQVLLLQHVVLEADKDLPQVDVHVYQRDHLLVLEDVAEVVELLVEPENVGQQQLASAVFFVVKTSHVKLPLTHKYLRGRNVHVL